MKNVLFLVTGMTPQIITETVWALACDPKNEQKWMPDEICVVSTEEGLIQIHSHLFQDGVFARFKRDYPQLAHIKFDEQSLIVIKKDNQTLTDLKDPLDNELTADVICQTVREFTSDDNICLHVSIAGGRKTMGFYAGYALSLYGRSQDKMSHVLVEKEYERAEGFYYPTPNDFYVEQKENKQRLNAKNAQVWLADIPFVRLRSYIPEKSLLAQSGFSDVVNAINLANQPLIVTVNELDKKVIIADKICKLPPRQFAFYLWLLKRKKQGLQGISRPIEGVPYDHADEFWAIYQSLGKKQGKTIFDHGYFDQRNTYLKRDLEETFGIDVANKIGIYQTQMGYMNVHYRQSKL